MKIFFGPSSEFFAPNTPPSFWVEILNVVCPLLFPHIALLANFALQPTFGGRRAVLSANKLRMNKMDNNDLNKNLNDIADKCHYKRITLQDINYKNMKIKKYATLFAGLLSVFSAILLSAVITDFLADKSIQILSVIFSSVGGILAVYMSTIHNENEVATIYAGTAKFMFLRERMNYLLMQDNVNIEYAHKEYKKLVDEYTLYSEIYDKYILSRSPWKKLGKFVERNEVYGSNKSNMKNYSN